MKLDNPQPIEQIDRSWNTVTPRVMQQYTDEFLSKSANSYPISWCLIVNSYTTCFHLITYKSFLNNFVQFTYLFIHLFFILKHDFAVYNVINWAWKGFF